MADEYTSWHLDKRVSLATLAALILQFVMLFGSGVWFVSEFKQQIERNSRAIEVNTNEIEEINTELDVVVSNMSGQAVQLGRIEENISGLKRSIDLLVDAIVRQEERSSK